MKRILFIILFSISLFSSGCMTYYPVRESPDSLKIAQDKYCKILKFYLYDGKTIDVSEYDVKYYDKYKSDEKVFVYTQPDTIVKSQNPDSIKIKPAEKIIPADQIKSVTVEKRKTDTKSTIYTVLIIAGSLFVLLLIVFSTMPDNLHVKM
jgi:hypothetical protein